MFFFMQKRTIKYRGKSIVLTTTEKGEYEMKSVKKLLSILLVLCMLTATVPTSVIAAENNEEINVTSFTITVDDKEPVSLLSEDSELGLEMGESYTFQVTFNMPDKVENVCVISEKDDSKMYLDAYNNGQGVFVTNGYFGDDRNYIPGTIHVEYTRKYETEFSTTDLQEIESVLRGNFIKSNGEPTRNESGEIHTKIDISKLVGELNNEVLVDAAISFIDEATGTELEDWQEAFEAAKTLYEYVFDRENEEGKYLLAMDATDFRGVTTIAMFVKDGSSILKFTLSGLDTVETNNLSVIVDKIEGVNTVSKLLYKYLDVHDKAEDLRKQIDANSSLSASQKEDAYKKVTEYENDRKIFTIVTTILPTAIAIASSVPWAFASMTVPGIIFTGMLETMKVTSDYFWEHRVGMLPGNEPLDPNFFVSGTCGEHLTWSFNGGGKLTISGYGPMTEFPTINYVPWSLYYKSIKAVQINPGATSIGRTAFADCIELASVSIPDTVESIGEYAFKNCYALKRITIPGSVSIMAANVFENCSNLNSIGPVGGSYDIQYGWTEEIPANAFTAIGANITSVVISNSIKRIGDSAFFLTDITDVHIPNGVISIGDYAFASTKLTQISIPESVTTIGNRAFSGCDNLKSITLPPNITNIDSSIIYGTEYYDNDSNWDQDVLYIGNYLIRAKTSVSGNYYIRPETSCIADGAFDTGSIYYNNLTSIVMPSSMMYIGRNAFRGCRSSNGFTGIYFEGNAPRVYAGGTQDASFYDHTTLYYIEGKEGWNVDMSYITPRWCGYYALIWEKSDCEHTYKSVVTSPTCTERGYTTHTCSKCGDSYQDSYTDALGHSFGAWSVVQEATSTTSGLRERVCSVCQYKETETIPATGGSSSGLTGNGNSSGGGGSSKPSVRPNATPSAPTMPTTPTTPSAPNIVGGFSDVPTSNTFAAPIAWAQENGIMGGYSDGTFRPSADTNRQQMWMVLARMAGASPANMTEARTWAVNSGISDGTNSENTMSRQQLVTMLYRFAQSQGVTISGSADLSAYPDNNAVASYAQEALAWAVGNGIVTGTMDGRLNPEGTATRAHFAAFLYRYGNLISSADLDNSEG